MTVYIVTANYVAEMVGESDFIVDSVWWTSEEAQKRSEEIDAMTEYSGGIYGTAYYGEVIEKDFTGKPYTWIDEKEFNALNNKK